MEKKEPRNILKKKIKKEYLDFLQILLDKTDEEEQYEFEMEQKKLYNKLYKTLMAAMVDNVSETERKKIRNEKDQIK